MNRAVAFSFLLLVVAAFFSTTYAAVYHEHGTKDEADPSKCFSESNKISMTIGQNYQVPGSCAEMSCDNSLTISKRSCGSIGVPKNCRLSEVDLTKPYPDCCPHPICD